jgi:polyhydroxyalkanoate synthesis regulator phasin
MTDLTEPQAPASEGTGARAAGVASATKEHAASVASTAVDEAKQVASEATAEAKHVVDDARHELRVQAEEQSARLASAISDVGAQLHRMAAAGDPGTTQHLVAELADRTEQIGHRLADGGLDRTLADARRIARNRPGLFLAGAALAGFVTARVFRLTDTASLADAAHRTNGAATQGGPEGSPQVGSGTASMPPSTPELSSFGAGPAGALR